MSSIPLPINIHELLHGKSVEWERLEFKSDWNPPAVLKTMCAFANDFHNLGGGYIVIGVAEENGRPILPPRGLDATIVDHIQKELLNLGYSAIQPAYHPVTIPYAIADLQKDGVSNSHTEPNLDSENLDLGDGRVILIIWVPGGQTRPYKVKLSLAKNEKEYGYFIRKGSSTVRAKSTDETDLLSLAATVPFDDRFNQRAKVDDIHRELILKFLHDVGSDLAEKAETLPMVELGRHMHIIDGPQEAPFPLNVGLLFFNPDPYHFFPATQIDVVWFPNGPAGDSFTEKTFRGPLPTMIRDTLDYIQRSFLSLTIIKHADRAEASHVSNFPYEAIEEAVVNAIYHRSYEIREPVEIRITREELVVLSFPGPERSIRMEQLSIGRSVPRRYRNRRIGEFLKELQLTEGRATGIPKILKAMDKNGSPTPEFETDEDRTYFLVRLPIHPAAYNDMGLDQVIEIKAETGADAVAKSVAKGTAKTGVEVGADANADTSQKSTFTRAQEKIASSFSKVLTKLWPSFHSNKEIFPRT